MTLMMAICGRKKAQNLEVTGGRPAAKWNNDAFHLKREKKIRVLGTPYVHEKGTLATERVGRIW